MENEQKTDGNEQRTSAGVRRHHLPTTILHRNDKPFHERTTRLRSAAVAVILLASLGFGFLGGWLGSRHDVIRDTSVQKQTVLNEGQLISGIAKDVGPSVVSVNVTGQTQSSPQTNLFDVFGQQGGGQTRTQQSAGTGIILSSSGVIVTNRHVVPAGTTKVSITLSDGTELNNVQVIGRTSDTDSLDVAFLKVTDTKGKKLVPAKLGDSGSMQVGDRVVAIGNALGQFQNTVTSGIISGHGRSVQAGEDNGGGVDTSSGTENLQDLFQTDAAINEGNSGGPLVNANSEVIAINTAIASDAQSVGFAIPINDIKGLIDTVLSTGKFEQPYLGVRYIPITGDVADQLNLPATQGAYVLPSSQTDGQPSVVGGSPAAKAGLQEKDIIQTINGTKIDESHSLTSLLDQHKVGDTVQLGVLRGKDQKQLSAKLDALPTDTDTANQ